MELIAKAGNDNLATVYIAKFENDRYIEFVESFEQPIPKEKKWVLIVSTMFGCPVKCKFCDCSLFYHGKLDKKQILSQIDYLVTRDFPDRKIPVEKFKIQFARMGEPALNNAVLDVLEELPEKYDAPGLLPSISTIAPIKSEQFFERLITIKNKKYSGRFQLQFSIHSTNQEKRDWLVPYKKWSFEQIANYSENFSSEDDRKITLNFALPNNFELMPELLLNFFDPKIFLIKITPINPTFTAQNNALESFLKINNDILKVRDELSSLGYEVILSVGNIEENSIGSNCGMHVMNYMNSHKHLENSYLYPLNSNI
jgi:23S rRNA (adenine2503-C2)-methyltransferase